MDCGSSPHYLPKPLEPRELLARTFLVGAV
jgi:DNA-binding response OmpR family regulator